MEEEPLDPLFLGFDFSTQQVLFGLFSFSLCQRQRLESNPQPWDDEANALPPCYCHWLHKAFLNVTVPDSFDNY
jgi:hypothetical protein